jgi:uncharacterized membrane protein
MELKYIILILFFILTPVLVIYFEKRYDIVKKVGAVLLCYAIGLIIGNLNMLPDGVQKYQELLSNLTILLALPLILFSMNIRQWFTHAKETMVSLLIGLVSVIIMVVVGFFIFNDKMEDGWKVSGMLIGIYTGGTPNLAAMKTALNVPHELYILTHTYDMFLGAIYLVFILSIGQKVFLKFLPPFKKRTVDSSPLNEDIENEFGSYEGISQKKVFWPLMGAFGLSVAIVGVSVLLSKLVPDDFETAAIILLITTFGIALSFVPKINQIKKTFQGGMYIILIFCLVVASMADVRQLANISFSLFWYVGLAMFGSHVLHAFVAKFFKIDADTVIISGSALICSPPFVPVVAGALKNKDVILSGLIIGIAGYAIGNYLGVFIAYMLK